MNIPIRNLKEVTEYNNFVLLKVGDIVENECLCNFVFLSNAMIRSQDIIVCTGYDENDFSFNCFTCNRQIEFLVKYFYVNGIVMMDKKLIECFADRYKKEFTLYELLFFCGIQCNRSFKFVPNMIKIKNFLNNEDSTKYEELLKIVSNMYEKECDLCFENHKIYSKPKIDYSKKNIKLIIEADDIEKLKTTIASIESIKTYFENVYVLVVWQGYKNEVVNRLKLISNYGLVFCGCTGTAQAIHTFTEAKNQSFYIFLRNGVIIGKNTIFQFLMNEKMNRCIYGKELVPKEKYDKLEDKWFNNTRLVSNSNFLPANNLGINIRSYGRNTKINLFGCSEYLLNQGKYLIKDDYNFDKMLDILFQKTIPLYDPEIEALFYNEI